MYARDPERKTTARPGFLTRRYSADLAPSSPPLRQERVAWVDVAKGLTILLVVVFHAQIYLAQKGLGYAFYEEFNNALKPVRMPLFFVLSGALAASLVRQDWGPVLKKRVLVFAYLFLLWSTIHIAAFKYLLWHPFFAFDEPVVREVLLGMIRPRTAIWFIWALAFYILFARGFRTLPSVAVALSLTIGLIGASGLPLAFGATFLQQNLFLYLPFFVIPALCGKGLPGRAEAHPLLLLGAGVVLSAGTQLIPDLAGVRLDNGLTAMVRCLGGLCIGVAVAVCLARLRPLAAFFSYFGQRTLPLYLLHVLFLSLTVSFIARWPLPELALYGLPLVVGVVVALSVGTDKALRALGQSWLFQPVSVAGLVSAGGMRQAQAISSLLKH